MIISLWSYHYVSISVFSEIKRDTIREMLQYYSFSGFQLLFSFPSFYFFNSLLSFISSLFSAGFSYHRQNLKYFQLAFSSLLTIVNLIIQHLFFVPHYQNLLQLLTGFLFTVLQNDQRSTDRITKRWNDLDSSWKIRWRNFIRSKSDDYWNR